MIIFFFCHLSAFCEISNKVSQRGIAKLFVEAISVQSYEKEHK